MSDPGLVLRNVDALSIVERTCSGFSLVGSVLVIASFSVSKAFHKPINRLVFYATFGNLLTNVATLISQTFIGDTTSAGCQFQAFLIQMFMPADAFWTLSMAVNVYLTFYFKFDARRLRRMEVPYLLFCYGLPFIVAFSFIFISTPERGRMYGNATLWCWISPRWDIFRIATFYGPVWIVIVITFFIYIRAGSEIYKKHKQLREFTTSHQDLDPPQIEDMFGSLKTTEVRVTTEAADENNAIHLAPLSNRGEGGGGGGGNARPESQPPEPQPPKAAYSVTISSNQPQGAHGDVESSAQTNADSQVMTSASRGGGGGGGGASANPLRRRAAYEANSATWSYTKCAILFFTAMLVTWIPSSANRVYSVVHPGRASLPLEYMSAFVLPLQGFWNAIIYMVTSWSACKMLWDDVRSWSCLPARRRRRARSLGHPHPHHHPQELITPGRPRSAFHNMMMSSARGGGGGGGTSKAHEPKVFESESMTELANSSRPGSSASPTTTVTSNEPAKESSS